MKHTGIIDPGTIEADIAETDIRDCGTTSKDTAKEMKETGNTGFMRSNKL